MTIIKVRIAFPNRLTKSCTFREELLKHFLGFNSPDELELYPQNRWGYALRVENVKEIEAEGIEYIMEDTTLSCLYLAEYVLANLDKESAKEICDRIYQYIRRDNSFRDYLLTGLTNISQIEYAIECKRDYMKHIAKAQKTSAERAIQRIHFKRFAAKRNAVNAK